MRCFIAVEIPADIKKQIRSVQKHFEKFDNTTLVNPELLHSTLLFLGELDKEKVEETKKIISDCLKSGKQIRCRIEGTGVFPEREYMKVIWAGMTECDALLRIQEILENNLRAKGIYNGAKKFNSHITLARVRNSKNKQAILAEIDKTGNFSTDIFEINEIKLKESTLSPRGPEYHDIAVYKLREPA